MSTKRKPLKSNGGKHLFILMRNGDGGRGIVESREYFDFDEEMKEKDCDVCEKPIPLQQNPNNHRSRNSTLEDSNDPIG